MPEKLPDLSRVTRGRGKILLLLLRPDDQDAGYCDEPFVREGEQESFCFLVLRQPIGQPVFQ